jgi:hypothetical protein
MASQVKRDARLTSEERVMQQVRSERAQFKEEYVRWQQYYLKLCSARMTISAGEFIACNKVRRPRSPTRFKPFNFHLDQRRGTSLQPNMEFKSLAINIQ